MPKNESIWNLDGIPACRYEDFEDLFDTREEYEWVMAIGARQALDRARSIRNKALAKKAKG